MSATGIPETPARVQDHRFSGLASQAIRAPRRTVLAAFAGLLLVDLTLRLRGYSTLKHQLSRYRLHGSGAPTGAGDIQSRVLAAVDRAAMFYPRQAMCLQRSAVTTWLLRRRGLPAQMVIGCRHTPFYAHAWVELHGHVINDTPAVKQLYPELERI